MALRIRFQYLTGSRLGYSIERLSDEAFYDFQSLTFLASPAILISPLPEDNRSFLGRYKWTLTPTPQANFVDGDYAITIHNLSASNLVVGQLSTAMHSGDDATVFPTTTGSASTNIDPWSVGLPGTYAPGSAGAILGVNLDAMISSRSTYAGGSVASITAPVTVGANDDKSGYILAPTGFDSICVEPGVNARQALSPILAASAGEIVGAGTNTIVIKGGNASATRITASTDNAGNRNWVTLSLPQ